MSFLQRLLIATLIAVLLGLAISIVHSYQSLFLGSKGLILENGEVFGGDFLVFYIAGKMAREDLSTLYDWHLGYEERKEILGPEAAPSPYIYPPLLTPLFAILSKLPPKAAYWCWTAISLALAIFAVFLVLGSLKVPIISYPLFTLALIAFPPFSIYCLAGGQTSAMGLVIYAGVFHFLKRGRNLWAGALLGLSYYKPPLFMFFLLYLIVQFARPGDPSRRTHAANFFIGFSVAAAIMLTLTFLYVGGSGVASYLHHASFYFYGSQGMPELPPGMKLPDAPAVGLLPFLTQNLPSSLLAWLLYALLAGMFFTFLIVKTGGMAENRQSSRFNYQIACAITLSLFLSPQMLRYDASIMAAPLTIMTVSLAKERLSAPSLLGWISPFLFFFEFTVPELRVFSLVLKPLTVCFVFCLLALFLLALQSEQAPQTDSHAV